MKLRARIFFARTYFLTNALAFISAVLLYNAALADQITRISVDSTDMGGPHSSRHSRVSSDGRYVVFISFSRLNSDDLDNGIDVYLRDRQTGITTLVSDSPESFGVEDQTPDVSDDGNLIVFADFGRIFLHDAPNKTTTNLSNNPTLAASGSPANLRISADGRYVAFIAQNANSTAVGAALRSDLFVYDTMLHTTEIASVDNSDNSPPNGSAGVLSFEMSSNGRRILFTAISNELVSSDSSSAVDVFLRDLDERTTTLVSLDESGQQFTTDVERLLDIDSAGETAVFTVGEGINSSVRVTTDFGTSSSLVGESTCNRTSSPFNKAPKISGNGRFIVLGTGDLVHDRNTNETRKLPFTTGTSSGIDINEDGLIFSFNSTSNLVTDDSNFADDVYVYTRDPIAATNSDPTILTIKPNQWEMLTLPCEVSPDDTVSDLFADDISGTYDSDWVVYTYNPLATPPAYVNVGLEGKQTAGQGFWILQSTNATVTLDLPVDATEASVSSNSSVCASEFRCHNESLSGAATNGGTTWNIAGNPFSYSEGILFDNVRVKTSSGACSQLAGCTVFAAASANIPVISNIFYNFDNANGAYASVSSGASLPPWRAYWIAELEGAQSNNPSLAMPASP